MAWERGDNLWRSYNASMNNRIKKIIAISMAAFIVTGCAVVGKAYDKEAVNTFQPGVTTKVEVIEKLGKPLVTQTNKDGEVLMQWKHVVGTPLGAKGDALVLAFDKDGTFTRVHKTSSVSNY